MERGAQGGSGEAAEHAGEAAAAGAAGTLALTLARGAGTVYKGSECDTARRLCNARSLA